jgi:hypothetical protein
MSLIKGLKIEGRKLYVSKKRLGKNSKHIVYKEKIWKIVGSSGAGITYKLNIEKSSTSERLWLDREQMQEVLYVVPNTDYMVKKQKKMKKILKSFSAYSTPLKVGSSYFRIYTVSLLEDNMLLVDAMSIDSVRRVDLVPISVFEHDTGIKIGDYIGDSTM